MIVFLQILEGPGQNGYIFGCKEPTVQLLNKTDLTMLAIFFKETVQMNLASSPFNILV